MAKRNTEGLGIVFGLGILVGLPILLFKSLADSIGVTAVIVGFLAIVALFIIYRVRKRAARVAFLRAKYGDEVVVNRIMQRQFWSGQTAHQLLDSLGNPVAIDNKLLKTKKREVWKYNQRGVNRYGLRITVENDSVVEWDQKN